MKHRNILTFIFLMSLSLINSFVFAQTAAPGTSLSLPEVLTAYSWRSGLRPIPHTSLNRQLLNRHYRIHLDQWQKAFLFLKSANLDSLPPGRYPIDGDNVFATISFATSKTFEVSEWEAHRNYIDIQYVIRGREQIGQMPVSDGKISVILMMQPVMLPFIQVKEHITWLILPLTLFFSLQMPTVQTSGLKAMKR